MILKSMTAAAALASAWLVASAAPAAGPAYTVTGSIAGPDGGWDYGTFDPDLRRFYVTHAGAVFAVDVDTGKVTPKLGDAPGSHKVVPLDGGRTLAVTVGADNTLRFLDAQTGATQGSVATGQGPDSATFDPASSLVIVAAHRGGEVDLIDPKAKTSAGTIAVGGALEELALDGRGDLFVNVEDKSELVRIDLKSKTITGRLKLEGCDGPTGLVFAPHAHALIAACDGKAAVVDAQTFKLETLLTIGKGPDAALYDPQRKLVLIPCGGSGEIAIISAAAPGKVAVLGMAPTERGARTGALDPKTGKLYLPAARFQPPAPGERRGKMEPGSFHIVVVSPAS